MIRYKIQIFLTALNRWHTIAIYNTEERASNELNALKLTFTDKTFQIVTSTYKK